MEGDPVPDLYDSFRNLSSVYQYPVHFQQRLASSGFTKPTPVQMQAIPVIHGKKSAIILAETGSGKSLAFIAPLLKEVGKGHGLQAVVVAPTRELTI